MRFISYLMIATVGFFSVVRATPVDLHRDSVTHTTPTSTSHASSPSATTRDTQSGILILEFLNGSPLPSRTEYEEAVNEDDKEAREKIEAYLKQQITGQHIPDGFVCFFVNHYTKRETSIHIKGTIEALINGEPAGTRPATFTSWMAWQRNSKGKYVGSKVITD